MKDEETALSLPQKLKRTVKYIAKDILVKLLVELVLRFFS
jgi:hypothetical protein